MTATHLWLRGNATPQAAQDLAGDPFGVVAGHPRRDGAFTAAGGVMRRIVGLLPSDVVQRHDIEVLAAAPDLSPALELRRTTLTSLADPQTRTRYYPHDRVAWIASGLTDVTLAAAERWSGSTLVVTEADDLDPSDKTWLAGLLRRADAAVLRVVVCSRAEPAEPLAAALRAHAVQLLAAPTPEAAVDAVTHVAALCLPELAGAAYDRLSIADRQRLHDAQAERLEAGGGAPGRAAQVMFHREHGSDPARAVAALGSAMQDALMAGFYDQVVAIGERLRAMVDWSEDEESRWLATVKMTIAYQAMGLPDDAMELFDDATAGSVLPSVHMQSAYGRAMVYTRYYDEGRRDLRKAKGLVNTAIALAALSSDDQRRAYNRTFNENGLALIDMHLGEVEEAVRLIEGGIARLDKEVEGGRYLLHRSVLRYNHAQLMVRCGDVDRALAEYSQLVVEDPHHPDYWFERALLHERIGMLDAAIDDYSEAIRVGPPYPEPIYNRGDLLMRCGEVDGALADFDRVLQLDPRFLDAHVNSASLLLEAGELEQARRRVEAGLELDDAQPHLGCLLAGVQQESGQVAEAIATLELVAARTPDFAAAWAALGGLHHDRGEISLAVQCLERAVGLSDDPDIRENLELVRLSA